MLSLPAVAHLLCSQNSKSANPQACASTRQTQKLFPVKVMVLHQANLKVKQFVDGYLEA